MPKKKEMKKIFDNLEPEATEAHAGLPETAGTGQEAPAGGQGQVQDEEPAAGTEPIAEEAAGQEQVAAEGSGEIDPEDLLEDVRKSLIEDETHEQEEGQSKWWKRFGRSSRRKTPAPEETPPVEEINLPPLADLRTAGEQAAPEEAYAEQLDELIDLLDLETEESLEAGPGQPVEEAPVEPEKPVDLEDLKRQAFQPRAQEGEEESLTEVRAIALEGGEEVFVEVEATPQDPLEERISAVENALKPYQRYINFLFAFLGLIMAVIAGLLVYNAYQRSLATREVAVQEVSNLPFPTSVSLPGGWRFNLGKGVLVDGNWNPAGAEWLQGTEVCRWVALPWSRQLEAVIRTLNQKDPIELGMSNNDTLTYSVYSIKQMSPQEMQALDSNSPCLLIVLAEPESEQRWVLTALP